MANTNGHGGYRRPTNPAAVSGPGRLSRRTDGKQPVMNIPSQSYGDGTDIQNLQASAPMYQAPNAAPALGAIGGGGQPPQMPTPIHAPSALPDVPVTAGANAGAGPDMSALNLPSMSPENAQQLRAKYEPILPVLIAEAQSKYATQQFKNQVAALIALM